jgi:hypothetical protein
VSICDCIHRRALNKNLSHNPRLHLFRPATAPTTTYASISEKLNGTILGKNPSNPWMRDSQTETKIGRWSLSCAYFRRASRAVNSPQPTSSRCWRAGRSRSAWMEEALDATMFSWSISGGPSNTRSSTYEPTPSAPKARASIKRHLGFHNGRLPHSSLDDKMPDQAYFNTLSPVPVAAQPRRKSTLKTP